MRREAKGSDGGGAGRNTLRLNFTHTGVEGIEAGIRLLGMLLQAWSEL